MLGVLLPVQVTLAQDFQSFKAGVVRIQNKERNEVGAGFILRVEKDRAYIITAAHVVRGSEHPEIYFMNRPNDSFPSDLIDREDDDQRGLALLVVKPDRQTLNSLTVLKMGNPSVKGGEAVNVIGFPDGTAFWSVTPASISRLEGRTLVFSGPIRSGNSGGPVLLNSQVIGLVTDTIQQSAYAVRAKNISVYIEGIPQLADLLQNAEGRPANNPGSAENRTFCQALFQIVDASRSDFSEIINHKASGYADVFESSINLPGMYSGTIHFEGKYFLAISKGDGKSDTEYYKLVSKVKACRPAWKEVPAAKPRKSNSAITNWSDAKSYRFITDRNVTVEINSHKTGTVSLFPHKTGISGRSHLLDRYHTNVKIYTPDSEFNGVENAILLEKKLLSALEIVTDDSKAQEICESTLKLVEASHTNFYSIVKPGQTPGTFTSAVELSLFPIVEVRPRQQVKFYRFADKDDEIETVYYRLIDILRRCIVNWRIEDSSSQNAGPPSAILSLPPDEYGRSFRFFEGNPGSVIEIRLYGYYGPLYLTIYSPNSGRFRK
jgi:hypothetical protein